MSQTTVADNMSKVFAGVLGDDSPNYVRSYANEAAASIPFGVLVVQGTADEQALETVAGGQPLGVVVHSHRYAKDTELDSVGLTQYTEMGVLRKGTIWVLPEEAVVPGDPVRVRHTAGVGETKGRFRTGADTTDCAVLSNAAWLTSGNATTPALLEVDLTAEAALVSD